MDSKTNTNKVESSCARSRKHRMASSTVAVSQVGNDSGVGSHDKFANQVFVNNRLVSDGGSGANKSSRTFVSASGCVTTVNNGINITNFF
jgi:hypothetical protein